MRILVGRDDDGTQVLPDWEEEDKWDIGQGGKVCESLAIEDRGKRNVDPFDRGEYRVG